MSASGQKLIEIAAGVVVDQGRYLIARRRSAAVLGGLWEFPGGKRNPGETDEECLRREIREELGLVVRVDRWLHEVVYPYPHGTVAIRFYRCTPLSGAPSALGCEAFEWVRPEALPGYPCPPANLPLVFCLKHWPI